MTTEPQDDINAFLNDWGETDTRCKTAFIRLQEHLAGLGGVRFEWHPRPGVTYSLRAAHVGQAKRPLFAMVDVIDDDPSARWLSACFYGELITDPEERGDFVPGGLLGEDAVCFDIDEYDQDLVDYVQARLSEAWGRASAE
jgi:hypothetical protein